MVQALYRKYRSRSFDEVVGQEYTTKTLKKALKSGRIGHAYLFTGPRGVGKTSVARILAHEANNLPYESESLHLDIIEIDAASNRRIDEIRDLREKVHVAPALAKYKVYIIDEVHMLTREAFNALLKTLEEPPRHCIFILATTEAHKLPETIISRTQRFNFKPISSADIATHLTKIARSEKISIDPAAVLLLAEHGEGSFRDSIGLLDQLGGLGSRVSEQMVRESLGLPPPTAIAKLIELISSGQSSETLETLDGLRQQGAHPSTIARQLSGQLRQQIMSGNSETWSTDLLKQLLEVSASARPQDYLEISVLEAATQNSSGRKTNKTPRSELKSKSRPRAAPVEESRRLIKKNTSSTLSASRGFDLKMWPNLLVYTKKTAPALYSALRLAVPKLANGRLELIFPFALHQKKVNQAKYIDLIGKKIEDLSGSKLQIRCLVDKTVADNSLSDGPPQSVSAAPEDSIQNISNIFGTAEVLES